MYEVSSRPYLFLLLFLRRRRPTGKPSALLLQWAEGLVSGRADLAILFDSGRPWFEETTCEEASGGVETVGGWHCLFQRMPHICVYDNQQVDPRVRNPWRGTTAQKKKVVLCTQSAVFARQGFPWTALARLLLHLWFHVCKRVAC